MQTENVRYLGCVEKYSDELGGGEIRNGAGRIHHVSFRDVEGEPFGSLKPWLIVSFEPFKPANGIWRATAVRVVDRGTPL